MVVKSEDPRDPVDRALARTAQSVISGASKLQALAVRVGARLSGELSHLRRVRDVPYGRAHADQVFDVWTSEGTVDRPRPTLLYLHGGGFQLLSKDTHWHIAARFARAGFVVFCANYGLAPRHAFPTAAHDALAVYEHVLDHAASYGGDPQRIVVAGESAGANLALVLSLASTHELDDVAAQRLFARKRPPNAALLYSGLYQTSDMARFFGGHEVPRIVRARAESISYDYVRQLPSAKPSEPPNALLDPLVSLEREFVRAERLPPLFATVGSHDPIRRDTLRLERVLKAHGATHRVDVFRGEPHAFEGMPFRKASHEAFAATLSFLRGLSLTA